MLGTETWAPARKATLTLTYQTNIYDTLWEFIPNKKGICVFRERERDTLKKRKKRSTTSNIGWGRRDFVQWWMWLLKQRHNKSITLEQSDIWHATTSPFSPFITMTPMCQWRNIFAISKSPLSSCRADKRRNKKENPQAIYFCQVLFCCFLMLHTCLVNT